MSFGRELLLALRRPIFTFLIFMSGTVLLLGAVAFHLAESGPNPQLHGFLDSIYFSVTTMTGVGFGDIVPHTTLGKLIAICMMLGGTGIFVAFTAVLATSMISIEQKVALRHARHMKRQEKDPERGGD